MSQIIRAFEKSFVSTNDLSAAANQYCIVKADVSNDQAIVLAAAATDPVVGILVNLPKATKAANVQWLGSCKVIAGGTVTRGDKVTSDSSGHAITTTSSGNTVVGIALSSAVSGDIFEILLTPGAKY
jgi:hypothetical protein